MKKCLNCGEGLTRRQEKYCSRKCKDLYRSVDVSIRKRISIYTKRYRVKNKKRIRGYDKQYKKDNKDRFSEYNTEYGEKYRANNKGKMAICNKKYRQKNGEMLRKKTKKYQQKNKKILNIKKNLRRQKNIEIFRKKEREYYQNNKIKIVGRLNKRYKDDSLFRLGRNISSSMRMSLKSKNLSKNGRHWEDIVGYSVYKLKNHLENLFQEGMSWDNHGKWHIDHIIPKSFFAYSSTDDVEFKYCWSLDNLQPLWAKDNMFKNSRIMKKYLKSDCLNSIVII